MMQLSSTISESCSNARREGEGATDAGEGATDAGEGASGDKGRRRAAPRTMSRTSGAGSSVIRWRPQPDGFLMALFPRLPMRPRWYAGLNRLASISCSARPLTESQAAR